MIQMLNRCRFGVLLSQCEGPALVMAEYLLCGLPVVAYQHLKGGGLHFLDGRNSLLFQDDQELAEVLWRMRQSWRQFGPRESALEQIGIDRGNRRLRSLLRTVGLRLSEEADLVTRNLSHFPFSKLLRKRSCETRGAGS